MKTYILTAKTDRETGELGYMIEGTPVIQYPMVAAEGLLVAHDLLEHVNGVEKIGSLDDELEALAGVWYVRGQWGDIRRDRFARSVTPHDDIAADVLNMALIYNNGVDFRTPVPSTRSSQWDDDITAIIDKAKEDLHGELDADEINVQRIDDYFAACVHYMRVGFRKIEKRFPSATWVNTLFWNIAEAAEPWVTSAEFEGHQLQLKFEISTANVWIDEHYPDEDYY